MSINEEDILKTVKKIKAEEDVETPTSEKPVPQVIQEALNSSCEVFSGISVRAFISYESMSSNVKKREFLIRRIIKNKEEYFIDGVAIDLKAPRVIRVSQISYITDIASKTTYADPYKFLQNVLGIDVAEEYLPEPMTDFAKAIQETGSEITVLMYLVALDSVRDSNERKCVLDYVRSRVPYLDYSDEQMNDYLISLAPDDDSFAMAFHRVLKRGKLIVEPLFQTIINVITADGVVHQKEKAFLARLIDWLKQDGYQIDVIAEK